MLYSKLIQLHTHTLTHTHTHKSFPGGSWVKESTCNAGDLCSIPGLGRCPGGGHANSLQYSCLENPHEQRSLACCRPWGHKESDMTEWLSTYVHVNFISEYLTYGISGIADITQRLDFTPPSREWVSTLLVGCKINVLGNIIAISLFVN